MEAALIEMTFGSLIGGLVIVLGFLAGFLWASRGQ
jgi:hypothetical protein